jgi:tRNA A37 methylthiotransferase MiaB
MILKRMKRRHTTARRSVLERAHAPSGVVFGADFIAGFPPNRGMAGVRCARRRLRPDALHVFPFSGARNAGCADAAVARKGQARAARLRQAGKSRWRAIWRRDCATSTFSRAGIVARAPSFAPVKLSAVATPGLILRARILHTDDRFAYAEAAEAADTDAKKPGLFARLKPACSAPRNR